MRRKRAEQAINSYPLCVLTYAHSCLYKLEKCRSRTVTYY